MASSIHDPTRTQLVTAAEVRTFSGHSEAKDISDADLNIIIKQAQDEALSDIAVWKEGVRLIGNTDGSNTVFRLPSPLSRVVDETFDEIINASDVRVYTLDGNDPPTITEQTVSSIESRHGRITLASAVPSDETPYVDGFFLDRKVQQALLKKAIMALSAHYVDKRVRSPSRVAIAHPNAGKKAAGRSQTRDWLADYEAVKRKITGPLVGNATVDTGLSRDTSEVL